MGEQTGGGGAGEEDAVDQLTRDPARIFLVDDHELVRRGLVDIVEAAPDLEVVGEGGTCRDAAVRIAATRPDAAIVDIHLPDGSGIDLCRDIRQDHPDVRVVMLTAFDDEDAVLAAVLAGASGYLLKTVRGPDLVATLRAVIAGRTLIAPALAERATRRAERVADEDPRFGSLSLRERQILALIGDALTNREISERLDLSEKTVKNYVSKLLTKLGFTHRTQAVVFELGRRDHDAR